MIMCIVSLISLELSSIANAEFTDLHELNFKLLWIGNRRWVNASVWVYTDNWFKNWIHIHTSLPTIWTTFLVPKVMPNTKSYSEITQTGISAKKLIPYQYWNIFCTFKGPTTATNHRKGEWTKLWFQTEPHSAQSVKLLITVFLKLIPNIR